METKFQNGAHLRKKRDNLYVHFTFFSTATSEKTHYKFLQHISHIHTRILLSVLNLIFCLPNSGKKIKFIMYGFSLVRLLLLILLHAILGQSIYNKMLSKIKVEMSTFDIYTNAECIVICKPRTLNKGRWSMRWRLGSLQKTQKRHRFLAPAVCFL